MKKLRNCSVSKNLNSVPETQKCMQNLDMGISIDELANCNGIEVKLRSVGLKKKKFIIKKNKEKIK